MAEKYCGQTWCEECQQIVDIYTEDNETFYCGFCDKIIEEE